MAHKKTDSHKGKNLKDKIAVEEADLWHAISRSVTPIDKESKNKASHIDLPKIEQKNKKSSLSNEKKQSIVQRKNTTQNQKTTISHGPQLTGIDRRSKQKLLRGNVEIDARLDLHGASQIEARGMLLNFLSSSQKKGANIVLVITGKGASPYTRHILHSHQDYQTPEREGVLRQNFPNWMHEKEFSSFISGFQPAHPKHGGGGAFYVKLRKLKNRQEME